MKSAAFALGVMVLAATLAGCGATTEVERSVVCPECRTVATPWLPGGPTFTRHLCPSCAKTIDAPSMVEPGGLGGEGVTHVCERCQAMLVRCPVCAAR